MILGRKGRPNTCDTDVEKYRQNAANFQALVCGDAGRVG